MLRFHIAHPQTPVAGRVKTSSDHLISAQNLWCRHLHHVEEAVVQDQALRHAQPVRLHGVPWPVVVASDLRVVEVRHLAQQIPEDQRKLTNFQNLFTMQQT